MNSLLRLCVFLLTCAATLVAAASSVPAAVAPAPGVGNTLWMRMAAQPPALHLPLPTPDAKRKIKHVVIIMQENRSFDNLFQGYPGANTQSYGYDSHGNKVTLQPVPLEVGWDIDHDISNYLEACDGTGSIPGTNCKMDGFDTEPNGCRGCTDPQYSYVPQSETTKYFNMAQQYVLADNMFTSHIDDSFISHQYIISGQANDATAFPNSTWGCDGGPNDKISTLTPQRGFGPQITACWDVTTLGDELDHHKKSWRFYASSINGDGGIWSAYQVIHHIRYGRDWTRNVISPHNQILTDVPNGKLASVTWVMPTCGTSDHSGCGSNSGPAWVTSVVNTIGQSQFWNSTAIFVTWDEWGGWYDHVAPPYVDFDGLGMRVPLLIISPYAKQNYVSHVQYEQGSILRFTEDMFGLPRMAASDARANSPASDAFDFTQAPRPFTPFANKLGARHFINEPDDRRIPDRE